MQRFSFAAAHPGIERSDLSGPSASATLFIAVRFRGGVDRSRTGESDLCTATIHWAALCASETASWSGSGSFDPCFRRSLGTGGSWRSPSWPARTLRASWCSCCLSAARARLPGLGSHGQVCRKSLPASFVVPWLAPAMALGTGQEGSRTRATGMSG
ncbi:unnamed protein product, partial [Symbiodinium sp. CCMP2456]